MYLYLSLIELLPIEAEPSGRAVALVPLRPYVAQPFALSAESIFYAAHAQSAFYTALMGKNGMPALGKLPDIEPGIKTTFAIDFGQFLPAGVTLSGTPSIVITDKNGIDRSPQITSGPTIGTWATAQGGSGVQNSAIITQMLGVAGASYVIWGYCNRSDGSDQASGFTHMNCNAPS